MSTERTYKILQDIDLSQNNIDNVKLIDNVYDENSSLDIKSNKSLELSSNKIQLNIKNNTTSIDLDSQTITSTSTNNKVVTTNASLTSTNDSITSENYVNNSNIISIGKEDSTSNVKITGNNLDLESGENSSMLINTIRSKEEHVDGTLIIKESFKIEWDNNTNSILFTKIRNE